MNTDTTVEMLKQLPVLNQSVLENFNVPGFSVDFLLAHQQPDEFPATHAQDNLPVTFHPDMLASAPTVYAVESNESGLSEIKKRKRVEQSTSSTKSISPATSTANTERKNSRRGKKGKNMGKGLEKAEEVVHVRAKRGLATDSHSTAERVRREKINNKLRCLRDIVPGCNKQMGMAVMLEEIINYVLSLQNQVQFLSMELAAATCHPYHLNMEAKLPEKLQETNSPETQEMQVTEKWFSSRYGEVTDFHPSWSI